MNNARPRVLVVQNDEHSGPGALELPLRALGADVLFWLAFSGVEPPSLDEVDAVVALGGRLAPDAEDRWLEQERELLAVALREEIPLLGLCLGAQLLVEQLGGYCDREPGTELGWTALEVEERAQGDPLLGGLRQGQRVFQWHYYGIHLPPGVAPLALTRAATQAFRAGPAAWGLQFHAEIDLSTAALWLVAGAEQLTERGIDPAALRRETAERTDANEAFAADLAARLLDLVHARVVRAAAA